MVYADAATAGFFLPAAMAAVAAAVASAVATVVVHDVPSTATAYGCG